MFDNYTDGDDSWPPTFDRGLVPLVFLLVAFAVLVVVANVFQTYAFGQDDTTIVAQLSTIPFWTVQAILVWWVLRYEGVSLRSLGFGKSLLLPALVASVTVVLALNVFSYLLVVRSGQTATIGFYYDDSMALIAVSVFVTYLFNGPVEEFFMRGYVQNKLVDHLGGRDRYLNVAVGILVMSVLFAVMHIPTMFQEGLPVASQPAVLLSLLISGISFGLIYELTHNLYFVAILHGIGNYAPLFVEEAQWTNFPLFVAVLVVVIVLYRLWASRTDRQTLGVPG